MKIRVRLQKSIFNDIQVPPNVTTLYGLKQLILSIGIVPNPPPSAIQQLTIVVKTRICRNNDASLSSLGITNDSLVHCVFPPYFIKTPVANTPINISQTKPEENTDYLFPDLDETPQPTPPSVSQPTSSMPNNNNSPYNPSMVPNFSTYQPNTSNQLTPNYPQQNPGFSQFPPNNPQHLKEPSPEAIQRLVQQGFPERAARNALRFSFGNLDLAQYILDNGLFSDIETNQIADEIFQGKLTPQEREQHIHVLLSKLAKFTNPYASEEQLRQMEASLEKSFHQIRNVASQNPEITQFTPFDLAPSLTEPQYDQLQYGQQSMYDYLNPYEAELVPELTKVFNSQSTDNPFILYLQNKDQEQIPEEIFDNFMLASSLEGPQLRFLADAMLNYHTTLSNALFILEAADNIPETAYAILKQS